jgi:hypothetical protein
MPRGLDHIVHAVRDLDAVGAAYRRLGFTVGARNRHPWGTHNRIIQFPGFFIELLSVEEPDKIPLARSRVPSFGAFNRDFLARREGFSTLVLESRDAAADAVMFEVAGIGAFDVFRFEREGAKPDGSPVKVVFSLAFASDPQPADAGFFTCQQHAPENFWDPAFQNHANGVTAVAGVVLVADNPTDHHIFLSAFVGERELDATSTGITVRTPRGTIQVMDPAAYRNHYGIEPPSVSRGACMAALRLAVTDIAGVETILADGGIAASKRMGRVIVPPAQAHGAAIVFEQGGVKPS